MMGYSPEDVVGRTSLDLGLWADPEARAAVIKSLLTWGSVRDVKSEFHGAAERSGSVFFLRS